MAYSQKHPKPTPTGSVYFEVTEVQWQNAASSLANATKKLDDYLEELKEQHAAEREKKKALGDEVKRLSEVVRTHKRREDAQATIPGTERDPMDIADEKAARRQRRKTPDVAVNP